MAFPGSRTWKLRRPIKASVITGTLNFDGAFCLRHGDFPDSAKTLNGADAMQQYGADLAVSSDEAGTTRLALQVVRCELDATPANSRIELWMRVPAVSDTVDTDVWIWWGDATETLPANDADYGRDDVWNGTTGGGTPITSWAVWHHDEDPADPDPPWKDSSGNAHSAAITSSNYTSSTRIDGSPGRAARITGAGSTYYEMSTTGNDAPGTGPWSIVQVRRSSVGMFFYNTGSDANLRRFWCSSENAVFNVGSNQVMVGVNVGNWQFTAMSRDGDNVLCVANTGTTTVTGQSAVSFTPSGNTLILDASNTTGTRDLGFSAILQCAPNTYWMRALYDNILGTSIWDTTYAPSPAEVAATIVFDALNAGTEVRIYEDPHPQVWTVDFDALTPAGLSDTYITFQIQGSSAASDHYFWLNLDAGGTDPEPGGTGHEVAIATGDTDTEIAAAVQAILDAVTDLGATVDGTVVTVTNDRNGELTTPVDGGTGATITLVQCGGTATDEIDGIESSTGTSWTANYSILRPRRAMLVMLSISYENVRYSAILTTSGLVVPAGALQRLDRNYANPT